MEELAVVLVSAFDAHEMTVAELADAVRFAKPELVQFVAALFSTASMVDFHDEERRRYGRMVCSRFARALQPLN